MSSPLLVAPLLAAQLVTPAHAREVRARGIVVRATATTTDDGATRGELEIRGEGGVQHVELGRREVSPEMLLQSIDIVDANFDGHLDVVAIREFGAKWSKVDVYLFDPKTHRYTATSALSRALSSLSNPKFDPTHKIITTYDIGPSNPSRITYGIDGSRLHTLDSCRFVNPGASHVGTLIRSHGGESTYTHLRLSAGDLEPCGGI